jgi:hypothetical protein
VVIKTENINFFKSLFRGRNDVYAIRWEKDGKSGYMPDYKVDWGDYKEHKASGGSFKDYKKKEYLPFDEDTVLHHFEGRKTVGIYPLLEDNTSYFIAADFDEANWKDSILKLHYTCQEFEIPAYIERSLVFLSTILKEIPSLLKTLKKMQDVLKPFWYLPNERQKTRRWQDFKRPAGRNSCFCFFRSFQ